MKAVLKKGKVLKEEMKEKFEEPKGKETKADKIMDRALKHGKSMKKAKK